MSWYSRFVLPAFVILCASASAQRVQFSETRESNARLDAKVMASNAEVAPVEIHLSVPGIDVDRDADGFDRVTAGGLVPTTLPGNPEVSTTGALIVVPEGFEPTLTIVNSVEKNLANIQVRPAQRKFRCAAGQADSFAFNADLYRSTDVYPAAAVKLEEVGYLQNLHLMRVALNPIRTNLADKTLQVTTDVTARVTFERVARSAATEISPAFFQLAQSVTVNGQGLGRAVTTRQGQETLLIVVADEFQAAIQPLVEWKRAKGLHVEIATATQAGRSNESIKAFIKTFYNNHAAKPTYLLLVGNKTTVPTFIESTASGSAASDLQYSLLGGKDNVPDLFYGRLVADNVAEVTTQVNRWIQYEKAPTAGDWWANGTTIASGEGSNPSDKEYAEQIQAALKSGPYKNVDGFYQGESTATASNISGALADGRSWLSYIGHGSGTSWGSTNDTFNVSTVESQTNVGKLPVIIDVACQNASWVKLKKCFGKAWVTSRQGDDAVGAAAFYGGSVNISWHEPAVMAVGVAKSHFEKQIPSLGGSVIAGQLYLVEKMGAGDNTLDNLKWYNLLGDPSLTLRGSAPAAN